ncbi:DNA glycosylase/AP lyase [Powellomyces hirtus]|nr:DNA glycosylase/AP lyase [Powellomyces hirtus]
MPELPAVERARKLIHENFLGKTITHVVTIEDAIVYHDCQNTHFEELVGKKLVDTGRRGKIFYLLMDEGPNPVLHLGMTGSVRIKGEPGLEYMDFSTEDDNWPPKYWKFVIRFDDDRELAFTDARRLGRIRLVDGDVLIQPPISELGFDPILSMPTLELFSDLIARRNCPIKALLLDQSFSAGVGNWIADEILYQARVHPAQRTNTLTPAEIKALYEQTQFIMKTAVKFNADGNQFPVDWLYHFRWGRGRKKDRGVEMPDGSPVVFETVGGRTSAIVPSVQKLHGANTSEKSAIKKEIVEDTGEASLRSALKRRTKSAVTDGDVNDAAVKRPKTGSRIKDAKPVKVDDPTLDIKPKRGKRVIAEENVNNDDSGVARRRSARVAAANGKQR